MSIKDTKFAINSIIDTVTSLQASIDDSNQESGNNEVVLPHPTKSHKHKLIDANAMPSYDESANGQNYSKQSTKVTMKSKGKSGSKVPKQEIAVIKKIMSDEILTSGVKGKSKDGNKTNSDNSNSHDPGALHAQNMVETEKVVDEDKGSNKSKNLDDLVNEIESIHIKNNK